MNSAVKRLPLRPAGMFSNVNEVVENLRLAEAGNYQFVIDWHRSCYRDETRQGDPWEYYFEPCFDIPDPLPQDLPDLENGPPVCCTRDNIITPRLEDSNCNPLLLPRDRLGAHDLISRYLRLNAQVEEIVSSFRRENFSQTMIGLHIRGPGRVDGGVPELRRRFGAVDSVPVDAFFRQVDEVLRLLPDAQIFACSDSSAVIASIAGRFGDRVITWPALRSEFGEMHANHPKNGGQVFSRYQLGLDVVVEAWLLSQCDLFVHGNSNVANFVLCKSPYLLHCYIQA